MICVSLSLSLSLARSLARSLALSPPLPPFLSLFLNHFALSPLHQVQRLVTILNEADPELFTSSPRGGGRLLPHHRLVKASKFTS